MKCQGNFVYKSITHREGGTFKNDKGEEVPYNSAYVLKVDEISEDGSINERKFKIAENKVQLINDLKAFEAYDKIVLTFIVNLYTSSISLEVCEVEAS